MTRLRSYILTLHVILFAWEATALGSEHLRGGEKSSAGSFKYQVSLQVNGKSVCGGGILSDYYVLSVAHCVCDDAGVYTNETFKVVAGRADLKAKKLGVEVPVEKIYVHKEYLPDRKIDDIAVLKLKKSLLLATNPHLSALVLPTFKPGGRYTSFVGEKAMVAGYGWDWVKLQYDPQTKQPKELGGVTDPVMKYAAVNIISNKDCKEKSPNKQVIDTFLCGMAIRRSPALVVGVCSGDSGSPLVIGDKVVGVLSTSPTGCDESKEAAVYTRVEAYVPFILNAMSDKADDKDTVVYTVATSFVTSLWDKIWGRNAPTDPAFEVKLVK